MLNVVIVGAGDVGSYIASMLSKEGHNVILIDQDSKRLEEVSSKIDVGVKKGTGTDWQLLDDLLDLSPDFFISLTQNDEINLTACSIAKNLGYPKTVARVTDDRYLNRSRLDFERVFDTDYFIGPEILVANEIQKYVLSRGSLAVETFAHGAVQLRTIKVPPLWNQADVPIRNLVLPKDMIIGLIKRKGEPVIFPHGDDTIKAGDEVTCIGATEEIAEIDRFFEMPMKNISSALLIGGTRTAFNLAKMLEKQEVAIRLIEKSFERCAYLADALPNTTVINQDGTNLDFLRSEKVENCDLVVSCSRRDETNLLASLVAKEAGAKQVALILSNADYHKIALDLGLSYAVSPRLATANRLLSLILSSRVTTCMSLYENEAEVIELQVSLGSKIVGIPISELGPLLPQDFLIAVIQNRGRIMIARGDRILSPGDSVIVVTNPRHVTEFQKVF